MPFDGDTTFETKKTFVSVLPLSVAAHRQLLRKILPPVSSLLNTWSTSMVPTVVLVKNEYCEPRLVINEKEQLIVVSRFFDAAIVLLLLSFT